MTAARARIAAAALCLAAASGCGGPREPGPGAGAAGIETAPRSSPPPRAGEAPLGCKFSDITAASGVRFLHVTGGYGEKLLPETMGSGGAFLDFDGDGRLDIFLVNSTWWPGRAPAGEPSPSSRLFRGRGDGTFEDVTAPAGAGVSLYGMGAAIADYDGDGDEDIYVTSIGGNILLRNDGGKFRDVTGAAGAGGARWRDREGREHPAWSTSAAWADVDLDGDLDLLVANYVEWTPENEIFTTIDGVTKAFTTPDRYPGLPCHLLLNRGDGSFLDGTAASGLGKALGKALGIAMWDFDGNLLPDFVIANDTQPNFLFLNRGGARFDEVGLAAGIAYDETGRARAGMGIDIQDYANDGIPGVAIGNFSDEPMSLYRWSPGDVPSFTSAAGPAGLAAPTYSPLKFGVLFLDADLDGVLDLIVVNGHIEPDVGRVFRNQTHAQPAQLFRGRGDGTFDEKTAEAGEAFASPRVGRGLAAGDIDGDGDLDILMTANGGPATLLRNDRTAPEPARYLRVRLRGKGKNTAAIGAAVRLTAGGVTQTRICRTGSSYLSQSEMTLTFGLGRAASVERLVVRWPGGEERTVPVAGLDRTLEVAE